MHSGNEKNELKYTAKSELFITDQLDLIKQLQKDGGFYYMIYIIDRSSEYFSPYALR